MIYSGFGAMHSGEIAYLRYHGDPGVVHTRVIVGQVQDDEYMIITPDYDIYVEELAMHNPDLAYLWRSPDGRVPRGLPGHQIYGFAPMTAAEYARLMQAGRAELDAELARRGLAGPGAAVVPAAAGGAAAVVAPVVAGGVAGPAGGGVAAAVVRAAAGASGPGAGDLSGQGLVWVAAESTGGFVYGEPVVGVAAAQADGARTVHTLGDGSQIFCMCISEGGVVNFNNRPSACDRRILEVRFNALGSPERPLSEVVAASKEYDMKWKMVGPRTTLWCLSYLSVEGLGFEAHHERFRQLCKVDAGAWGIQEHFQVSMFLRQLVQVDQLDACNSYGIELMFRRVQTIEYAHSERARENESRSVGGKLSLEEQYTFGSLVRQAGTLMICPSLLEHVKSEVEKDVQLSKNMRKAREERELARKNKKKDDP